MEVDGAENHDLHDTQLDDNPSVSAEPDSITERLGLRPFDILDDISCMVSSLWSLIGIFDDLSLMYTTSTILAG